MIIYFTTNQIIACVASIIILILIFFLVMLFLNLWKNIKRMQLHISRCMSNILIVLKERYGLIFEKINLIEDDSENKEKIIQELGRVKMMVETIDVTSTKMDGKYTAILENITMNLANIEKSISIYNQSNKKIDKISSELIDNNEYIKSTRRLFNSAVSAYNRNISMFPTSLIAHIIDTEHYEFIHTDDLTEELDIIK